MARYGLIRFDCKRHFAQEDFKTNMHWKLKSLIRLWIVSSAGERLGGWDLYGDVATQRLRDCFCFLVLLGSLHSRQNLWCWLKLHTNEIEIIVLFLSTFWIIMNLLHSQFLIGDIILNVLNRSTLKMSNVQFFVTII